MEPQKTLSTQDAHPGMIVAVDVRDRSGRLLIPAGTPLKEKHLRVLQIWGIATLSVRDPSGSAAHQAPAGRDQENKEMRPATDAQARAEAVLREVFRHADLQRPPMGTLFHLAVERLSRRMEQA
ncbi:hypothetical protein [Ectothiorhodospira mobilis]|uniref:hypothetical protein n=1 Tax=Ectothiorhodospira mobilis TaxID=195064 RepID=UPI001903C327|nr:hypothetical protein [Ectothiorhodospira mobilis]MBK1690787.1 hypothetical protein [Ectothiorhodospira mobilis]